MKPALCIGCGCDEQHACEVRYWNGLGEQHFACWWVRFDAEQRVGVCSACWDVVRVWDASRRHAPILPLVAERYYRQALFLYEDKASALAWMAAPQHVLGDRSPRDAILAGDLERVQVLVDQLREGALV